MPAASLASFSVTHPSSTVASAVSEIGPRAASASGLRGRPGAAVANRIATAVCAPCGFQLASPVAVAASPAERESVALPAVASPRATSRSPVRSSSGRSSNPAITPPCPSSSVISPSTFCRPASNRTSAARRPELPSVRSPVRRSLTSARSAGRNRLPASRQRDSVRATAAEIRKSSIDNDCRSMPTGSRGGPLSVDAGAAVFPSSGRRSRSTRAADTVSMRTRPDSSDTKDQRRRASVAVSQGPSRSASATCASRRSVGKKPARPPSSTRRSGVESSDESPLARARWPGGVCSAPNPSASSSATAIGVNSRKRRRRIRRLVPG